MTTTTIIVTVLGLVAIVWVNYWFFWAGRRTHREQESKKPDDSS